LKNESVKGELMKRSRFLRIGPNSAELKAKVAWYPSVGLEAIRGQKTINEIASQFDVHPNQVGTCPTDRPTDP
jgi:hypothetical protein